MSQQKTPLEVVGWLSGGGHTIAINEKERQRAMSQQNVDEIFALISRERAIQDEEWGGAEHDDSHERLDWINFIEKQCRIIRMGERPYQLDDYESRLVKIAAIAIAAIESDRRLHEPTEC